MCNRFRSIYSKFNAPRAIKERLRLNFEFNPNVAPTEVVPILQASPAGPAEAVMGRFGITMTGRDGKPRFPLTNARLDGLRRGQFKAHVRDRRCIIPCQGFYEFLEEGDGKQPYYFSRGDDQALLLAGIWEDSEYKGDRRPAFAILTDEPNALIAPYHDRMPYALTDEAAEAWLDLSQEAPLDGLRPLDLSSFTVRPMDRAMNSVRQKDLALIEPAAA